MIQMSSPSSAPSNITLRTVGPDDYDFLVEVYGSTRADEMVLVPWTSEQQQAFVRSQFAAQQYHYAQKYPPATHAAPGGTKCRDRELSDRTIT